MISTGDAVASAAEPSSVCVVVPMFNGARFVDHALGSIAAQGRLPEEVLVVDDCSTDGSAALAERWADVLPVRVLRTAENVGVSAARALAIDETDAQLIALLDVDDVWLPDHLGSLLDAHAECPGLVTANALKWVPGAALDARGWEATRPVPPVAEQVVKLLLGNYVFVGTLFSRELCLRVGGFRSLRHGCEDWDLWLRMAAAGAPITRVQVPTALYRLRSDSMSANDVLLDVEIAMLEQFKAEHDDARWLRAADQSIARRQARQHLRSAFQAASTGRRSVARGHALRALRNGSSDVRLASAAAMLWPSRAVAIHGSLRRDPTRSVRR